jgi:Fe-S-cluster containining protein
MQPRQSFAIKHGLRLNAEGTNIIDEDASKCKEIMMDSSYCDLLKAGIIFKYEKYEPPCQYFKDHRCTIQNDKPKLCRTYWCHGKYFERAE